MTALPPTPMRRYLETLMNLRAEKRRLAWTPNAAAEYADVLRRIRNLVKRMERASFECGASRIAS